MDIFKYLVLFGVALQFVGVFSYIRSILRGETKPNKVTWFMWSVAPLIATVAALNKGVEWAAIPVFMSGFGPFLIFIGSFFNPQAYWKLGVFDYLCGVFSLLALVLWWITKESNIAIALAIMSDGAAALPTLKKAWAHPESETAAPFVTGLFGAFTGIITIPVWVFPQYAFPAYLMCMNTLLIFSICRKKMFKSHAKVSL